MNRARSQDFILGGGGNEHAKRANHLKSAHSALPRGVGAERGSFSPPARSAEALKEDDSLYLSRLIILV